MKPQIEAVRLRPVYRALLALAGVCAIAAFVGYAYALANREDVADRRLDDKIQRLDDAVTEDLQHPPCRYYER